jgi:hypothetical protein
MPMVKKGPSSFVWESEDETEVMDLDELEIIDELWDETIDYLLALRAIVNTKEEWSGEAVAIAEQVLAKHHKQENENEEE